MNYIKKEYYECFTFLKKHIFRISLLVSLIFILVSIVSWVLLSMNSSFLQSAYTWLEILFNTKDLADTISAYALFKNNSIACLYSILLGFVPFFFVGVYSLVLNAATIGIVGAMYSSMNISLLAFFAGLIPHGIFEFPAIFLSLSLSFKLCLQFTNKITGKNDTFEMSYWCINLLRTYILVILPLLVLAALFEAYITPVFMNLFL